jgi:hypothetical protein
MDTNKDELKLVKVEVATTELENEDADAAARFFRHCLCDVRAGQIHHTDKFTIYSTRGGASNVALRDAVRAALKAMGWERVA